ncbi:hypothetical protein LA080_001578 [Diaporthe eres]|nr:hypothetical protein LA080_001578 [Diaporthe eres]
MADLGPGRSTSRPRPRPRPLILVLGPPDHPANPTQDFVGYPAAHSDGNLDLFNVDPALVFANPADDFEMSAPEAGFIGKLYDFDFDTFNL